MHHRTAAGPTRVLLLGVPGLGKARERERSLATRGKANTVDSARLWKPLPGLILCRWIFSHPHGIPSDGLNATSSIASRRAAAVEAIEASPW